MPANRSKRCSTRTSGTCRALSTIGSTWSGGSSSSSSATCDPGTRLRFRWPARGHGSPDLPRLATHLPGAWPGAAARTVVDDHRHRIRTIRSCHRPGREDRHQTRRGGSQGARGPLLPGGDGSAAASARRPRLPGRRASARAQNGRRIELHAQMGNGPPQSFRNRGPFRCHGGSRGREAHKAGPGSFPDGGRAAGGVAERGDRLRRFEQRRPGREGGGAVLRRGAQSAHRRSGSQRGRSAPLIARRDAAARGHQGGQPCEKTASAMKRWTNLALFVLLGVAFTTGWVAFFYGTAPSRASLIVHAASGYAIIALTPWKAVIAARGIQRRRPGWWASLVFTGLVIASIAAGILHSTGLLTGVGAISAMELHVGAALAAIPFVAWHVIARRIPVRAVDLSRRSLLRAGSLLAAAGLAYGAGEGAVRLLRLPGSLRRFTGSYEVGSLQPAQLPETSWMFDAVPAIDPATWRLTVQVGGTVREWTYKELLAFDDRVRATLDCTGGFYSMQDWSGVWLSRLFASFPTPARGGGQGGGSSIHVRSLTGYDRRFALSDAGRLLIATRLGGIPLDPGHGFPVRLVAPDLRGYWWVKWVTTITIDELPSWWQLPFPIQ